MAYYKLRPAGDDTWIYTSETEATVNTLFHETSAPGTPTRVSFPSTTIVASDLIDALVSIEVRDHLGNVVINSITGADLLIGNTENTIATIFSELSWGQNITASAEGAVLSLLSVNNDPPSSGGYTLAQPVLINVTFSIASTTGQPGSTTGEDKVVVTVIADNEGFLPFPFDQASLILSNTFGTVSGTEYELNNYSIGQDEYTILVSRP